MNRAASVIGLMAMLVASCGGNTPEAAAVDTSDPIQVAEAFFKAIDDNDLESAIAYVHPDQAADFRNSMSGGMPGLPGDYQVVVLAQQDHAEASIPGAGIEVDLVLEEGRWWVTR